MTWLSANWPQVIQLTGAHLALSLPAIVVSVLVAVPIGRLAARRPALGGPVLGAATLLYAIPALPLLIIIPVVAGTQLRSPATLIIALSIYGVAVLVRSAADAFGGIDAQVRDAAIAVGHSPRAIFWKVDLPLAVPVLLAGVRVVAVSTIGLVTIGALIGIPNLGLLLTDGFQRGITSQVAAGVIATVALALVVDAVLLAAGWLLTPWARTPGTKAVAS